ncbi:MAG TPA: aldo/keto reductase [Paenibacillus sp.]|nr:aldo/keto reductase [Paenibacillus sp.]
MKRNRLGASDLIVSEIGLGCMSLGTEETKAVAIVREALDRGVNFLDTADLYDEGRNEELVGKAIAGRRGDVIVATKVGNRRVPGVEGWVWDPSRAYIRTAVKESLRRLGTDYIDLYQLHGGTIDDDIDETIEAFEELKREGVIRHYGISSIRPNVVREYARRSNIVSLMNQYGVLDRRAEEEILPLLQARGGVGLIARGPLAGGALAESKTPTKGFLDYSLDELLALRGRLSELASEAGVPLSHLAIRFALSHPVVAAVIPGASSLEQLRGNLAAASVPPLTDAAVARIRDVSRANRYTAHR